jgi:hypothetical protein
VQPEPPRVSSPPGHPRSMPVRPPRRAAAVAQSVPAWPWCKLPLSIPPHMSSSQPARPSVPHTSLRRVLRALNPASVRVVRRRAIPVSSLVEMGSRRLPLCMPPRATQFAEPCAQQPQNTSSQLARTRFHIYVARRRDSDGVWLPLHLPPRTRSSTPCVRAFAPLASPLPALRALCHHVVLAGCPRSVERAVVRRCSCRPRALFHDVHTLFNYFCYSRSR